MGKDKALLPFDGHPTLTQYQIARFDPHFKAVYVGCKNREKFDFDADFLEDSPRFEDTAPFIGLISAFELLADDLIAVLSVDAPFFTPEDFQRLLDTITPEADACIAKSPNGNEPLCGLYRRTALSRLESLAKQKRYRFADLFAHIRVRFVPFDDLRPFCNLNYPEDYEKAARNI